MTAVLSTMRSLPSEDLIEETLSVAEELSSTLARKRRRDNRKIVAGEDAAASCQGQSEPRKKRPKKNVRFAQDEVKVFELEEVRDSSCWYREHDYARIKSENCETLIAIARAKGKLGTIDATSYCVRGLEVQIGITLLNMKPYAQQKMIVKRVLDLQQVQRNQQRSDDNALREMSRSISMHDKLKAWRTATIDACKN